MGWNTSAVILNDTLSNIEADKDLGKKIADGILQLSYGKPVDVAAGNHCNAIYLVEQHHADGLVPVLVGGNYGVPLSPMLHWSTKEEELEMQLLLRLAEKCGYTLRRKPRR